MNHSEKTEVNPLGGYLCGQPATIPMCLILPRPRAIVHLLLHFISIFFRIYVFPHPYNLLLLCLAFTIIIIKFHVKK